MQLGFRVLFTTLLSSGMLLIVLCLGSQNIGDRKNLNLGFAKTAPLPTGFLVGMSFVIGAISGGSATALIVPQQNKKDTN